MNAQEAIELLECSRLFYDSSMDLDSSGQAELLEFIRQLSIENEQLKAQLATAIVPKFKINQEVWLEVYGEGVIKTTVGLIQFDGDRIEYNVYIFTEGKEANNYCNYDEVPESELFSSQEEALASLRKEGES